MDQGRHQNITTNFDEKDTSTLIQGQTGKSSKYGGTSTFPGKFLFRFGQAFFHEGYSWVLNHLIFKSQIVPYPKAFTKYLIESYTYYVLVCAISFSVLREWILE